jgi:hypothetical protein
VVAGEHGLAVDGDAWGTSARIACVCVCVKGG